MNYRPVARSAADDGDSSLTIWYYGWINVLVAALLVNATLPGRTHGLGLITKPLLDDLDLDEIAYGWINFWSVLIGATFGVPLGKCIDRFGSRMVLSLIALVFGLVTLWTAIIRDPYSLFVALTLSRGLSQAGITVGAGALVGKWFKRRLGYAMGAYAILMGGGFVAITLATGVAVDKLGWRAAWMWLGFWIVAIVAPCSAIFIRSMPRAGEPELDALVPSDDHTSNPTVDNTLRQALASPAFWVFTLAYSMFALSWSAITLFNELMFEERKFGKETFLLMMVILPVGGGLAQLFVGWLANHWRLGGVMALGMLFLAASMAAFPWLAYTWQVVLYALGLGFAGSFIMVANLAFYPHAYGRVHLGQIQGAAQVVTVVMSAAGPLISEYCRWHSGSYDIMFYGASGVMLGLGLLAWFTPLPRQQRNTKIA